MRYQILRETQIMRNTLTALDFGRFPTSFRTKSPSLGRPNQVLHSNNGFYRKPWILAFKYYRGSLQPNNFHIIFENNVHRTTKSERVRDMTIQRNWYSLAKTSAIVIPTDADLDYSLSL